MTTTNSLEHANTLAKPPVFNPPGVWYSRVRCFQATVTLASQAVGDDIVLFLLPAGFRPAYGVVASGVSIAGSKLSIGTSDEAGKYRASADGPAADVPQLFGIVAATRDPLAASETVRLKVETGGAALPASGSLVVRLFGTGAD